MPTDRCLCPDTIDRFIIRSVILKSSYRIISNLDFERRTFLQKNVFRYVLNCMNEEIKLCVKTAPSAVKIGYCHCNRPSV